MSVYTIADLHLSLSSDKSMEVFSGWNNYIERLEKNWTKTINDGDIVIIPGDISWGMSLEESKKDFEFLNNLPGKKWIIKGNHDYWWTTKNKINKFFNDNGFNTLNILHNNHVTAEGYVLCGTRGWMYEVYTDNDIKIVNREINRLKASLDSAQNSEGEKIVFFHYPPIYKDIICEEVIDILIKYGIKKCYFGHIHGSGSAYAFTGTYKNIKFNLVSCDYTEFFPVKII